MNATSRRRFPAILTVAAASLTALFVATRAAPNAETESVARVESAPHIEQGERPHDPWMPRPRVAPAGAIERCEPWVRDGFVSVQVNVDENGCNILGDAANEPSIAIDPNDPNKIVIGFRQFDSVESDFRQAGYAYSHDGGESWTFPGVLDPGVFRSDPVLDVDADGSFYYYSATTDPPYYSGITCQLFKSNDRGITWSPPVEAFGGDKPWMAIDRTFGVGHGHIYTIWQESFARSVDGGVTFHEPDTRTGTSTITVGPDGAVWTAGWGLTGRVGVGVSTNAEYASASPSFSFAGIPEIGGEGHWVGRGHCSPNPSGLCGQMWIATDHSDGPTRGNVYLLGSVDPPPVDPFWEKTDDPLDVMFVRSTDGGQTWDDPVRVNDDPIDPNGWQWFGTMSVSPHGRIDAVFNDNRQSGEANISELLYTFSYDGGQTWAPNMPVSPAFDSHVGWPHGQAKLGDYYHMISNERGVNIAYAATFNGEQDVYFLRIMRDCNGNGVHDGDDIAGPTSEDCNANWIPDECDFADGRGADEDLSGVLDECESDVLYVKYDALGRDDGTSWENAYTDLQEALRIAALPRTRATEIWVAKGVYKPDKPGGRREATFNLVSGVKLYGGFAGHEQSLNDRNWEEHRTILSGDLSGNDQPLSGSNCCATHAEVGCDVTACTEIVCAADFDCCEAEYGEWDQICVELARESCDLCLPLDEARRIENVYHVVSAIGTTASTGLDGLVIEGGQAERDSYLHLPRPEKYGAGLFIAGGQVVATNCLIRRNVGGAVVAYSVIPYVPRDAPVTWFELVDCIIVSNALGTVGRVPSQGIGAGGGGSLVNCTVVNNSAGYQWAAAIGQGFLVNDCVVWGNCGTYGCGRFSQISMENRSVRNSNVLGFIADEHGNIGDDPLFVDPFGPDGIPGSGDEDYRLLPGSPCIDAGDNEAVPPGVTTDMAGRPRFVDDPDTPDTGNGDPPIVDMGAYEFQGSAVPATLDIKPDSCPNRLNPKSRGVLPVGLAGSDSFDISLVDFDSLELTREDGVGGSVTPRSRSRNPASIEDVTAHVSDDDCNRAQSGADGFDDLLLKFSTPDLVSTLEIESVPPGEPIPLTLTGSLLDGTRFRATDCVVHQRRMGDPQAVEQAARKNRRPD